MLLYNAHNAHCKAAVPHETAWSSSQQTMRCQTIVRITTVTSVPDHPRPHSWGGKEKRVIRIGLNVGRRGTLPHQQWQPYTPSCLVQTCRECGLQRWIELSRRHDLSFIVMLERNLGIDNEVLQAWWSDYTTDTADRPATTSKANDGRNYSRCTARVGRYHV